MLTKFLSLLLFLTTCHSDIFEVMDVPELIQYWGYPFEDHYVTTDDGYILNMHRIPPKNPKSPIIFLQHGLFGSSARFATGPPDKSLAYICWDLGYDVWLGNTRGNTYSRNHMTLDPDTDITEFWNFDWDVAGQHDLPANFEYMKQVTDQDKMFFLGHSMGSTEFLVVASEQPAIQDSLYAAFLLAPPAWMGSHTNDSLARLSAHWKPLERAFEMAGIWEFLPDHQITSVIGHEKCDDVNFETNEQLCLTLARRFFMVSDDQLNTTMLPIYFDVYPEGSSVKPMVHYGQLINSTDYFRKYDMGSNLANNHTYGQPVPPDYDVTRITLPTYLFYGDGDSLVFVDDVLRLAQELPNVQLLHRVNYTGWTHNDMVYAIQAPELLYEIITDAMDEILQSVPSKVMTYSANFCQCVLMVVLSLFLPLANISV